MRTPIAGTARLVLSILLTLGTAASAQELLSFDFTTDQSAQFQAITPSPPSASVSWDPANGVPPGALQLENAVGDQTTTTLVVSPCLNWNQAQTYRLTAQGYESSAAGCFVKLSAYPDCTEQNEEPGLIPFDFVLPKNEWVRLEVEVPPAEPSFTDSSALRIALSMQGVGFCRFDNIRLVATGEVLEIPATNELGLVALMGLVVGVALWRLRRA